MASLGRLGILGKLGILDKLAWPQRPPTNTPHPDRLTIPETPRYTFDVARDVEKADDDVKAYVNGKAESNPDEVVRAEAQKAARENLEVPKASFRDFCRHYSHRKNFLLLLGTAGSWFCLDVAYYGLSLNSMSI